MRDLFRPRCWILAAASVSLVACSTIPTGPSVMALPGSGKSFEQFRLDDMDCRQYAQAQSGGGTANDAATDNTVKSAITGAAVGALAGAMMGGHRSAGGGAGAGLIVGTGVGAASGSSTGQSVQRRYDNAYVQCMYAKGQQVPVQGHFMNSPNMISQPPSAAPMTVPSTTPPAVPNTAPSSTTPPPPGTLPPSLSTPR